MIPTVVIDTIRLRHPLALQKSPLWRMRPRGGQVVAAAAVCGGRFRRAAGHCRGGLSSDHGTDGSRAAGESDLLGHCWAGAVSHADGVVLSRCARHHFGVQRGHRRVVPKRASGVAGGGATILDAFGCAGAHRGQQDGHEAAAGDSRRGPAPGARGGRAVHRDQRQDQRRRRPSVRAAGIQNLRFAGPGLRAVRRGRWHCDRARGAGGVRCGEHLFVLRHSPC
eukprot:ctg_806.g171